MELEEQKKREWQPALIESSDEEEVDPDLGRDEALRCSMQFCSPTYTHWWFTRTLSECCGEQVQNLYGCLVNQEEQMVNILAVMSVFDDLIFADFFFSHLDEGGTKEFKMSIPKIVILFEMGRQVMSEAKPL